MISFRMHIKSRISARCPGAPERFPGSDPTNLAFSEAGIPRDSSHRAPPRYPKCTRPPTHFDLLCFIMWLQGGAPNPQEKTTDHSTSQKQKKEKKKHQSMHCFSTHPSFSDILLCFYPMHIASQAAQQWCACRCVCCRTNAPSYRSKDSYHLLL